MLVNDEMAYVVAHCRKRGNPGNLWGDIAVIQHSRKNGATCFYQEGPRAGLLNEVKAPSDPSGGEWLQPAEVHASLPNCASCHDNGPLIRSPYLTQVTGPNRLPGADDNCDTDAPPSSIPGDDCMHFNDDPQPYSFVGADFASWKAYRVEIRGNTCIECHRMGVNNQGTTGTSRHFGILATQEAPEAAKNPHSVDSPMWMVPGRPTDSFDQEHADAALAIKDCADKFAEESALPNSPACKITQFAGPWAPQTGLRLPAKGEIGVATRDADKLDIFVVDVNGDIQTASWEPAFTDGWHGWRPLKAGHGRPGSPITAASPNTDILVAVVTGRDGAVYTAHRAPGSPGKWEEWWGLSGGATAVGGRVTAISRGPDNVDVFVVGTDGRVYTAAWVQPAATWSSWQPIGDVRVPVGAAVHAAARNPDRLDIFVTDAGGKVMTAAWEPSFTDGWHGWDWIKGGRAAPGAPVTVVSRGPEKLDIFVTGTDGRVYTAAWQPDFTDGWRGWARIGDIALPQGAPVHGVSRSIEHLDIFATDLNGVILTAAWEPSFDDGWHGWSPILGGKAAPGAPVTAASRGTDKIDIFVTGLDGRVYTAAWRPDLGSQWRGWLAIGQ